MWGVRALSEVEFSWTACLSQRRQAASCSPIGNSISLVVTDAITSDEAARPPPHPPPTAPSAPAPALRPAPAAEGGPTGLGREPHEREEAALGAGGELGGNHLGSGEILQSIGSVFSGRRGSARTTLKTANNHPTCESSHVVLRVFSLPPTSFLPYLEKKSH